MQVQIQSRCARRWTAQSRRFGEFRSENHSIGCQWGLRRLTVEVGWQDRERWQEVFRSSLMCSQSESYKIRSGKPEFNSSTVKKVTYLFGLPLASVHKNLRFCDLCKELGFGCSCTHNALG